MYNIFDMSNDFTDEDMDVTNPAADPDSIPVLSANEYLMKYVSTSNENSYILNHANPLIVSQSYSIEPVEIHHVKPHSVDGYYRADGTYVEGYHRGGESGAGYARSNPDETTLNNLNKY